MGREVQRALLWVILFGSLFMLWDNYQVWKGGESFFGSAKQEAIEADLAAKLAETKAEWGLEFLVPKCFSSRNKPIGLKWVLPVWCLVGNPPPTLAM